MFHASHPLLDPPPCPPHCISYIIIYTGRRRRRRSRGRRRRRRRSRDRRRRRRRSRRESLTYIDVIVLDQVVYNISNHMFHCHSFHPQADPAVPVSASTVLGRGSAATAVLKERMWS